MQHQPKTSKVCLHERGVTSRDHSCGYRRGMYGINLFCLLNISEVLSGVNGLLYVVLQYCFYDDFYGKVNMEIIESRLIFNH